jgi:hypothetical protein
MQSPKKVMPHMGKLIWIKNNVLWWTKGGVLHGESPPRVAFLKEIIDKAPKGGVTPFIGSPLEWNRMNGIKVNDDYFLIYFGDRQHGERKIVLRENEKYVLDIIDAWNMTVTGLGTYTGKTLVLPSQPYIAVRTIKIK